MINQTSLFDHINGRYHAFKAEVLKDSHCETAQFWAKYTYIIQMVLTLIRATRKATLNCMSALSVCLVPNVHCEHSQQLRTIKQRSVKRTNFVEPGYNYLTCHNNFPFNSQSIKVYFSHYPNRVLSKVPG